MSDLYHGNLRLMFVRVQKKKSNLRLPEREPRWASWSFWASISSPSVRFHCVCVVTRGGSLNGISLALAHRLLHHSGFT